jgi:hypothetical protein
MDASRARPALPAVSSARSRRAALLLAAVLVLGGVGLAVWHWWPRHTSTAEVDEPPPPDPRLTYRGPFENIHPAVAYMGDQACVDCHDKEAGTYRNHPMARTLAPFKGPSARQPLDKDHHQPFTALDRLMEVREKDGRWYHRASATDEAGLPVASIELAVDYSVGSGSHGVSYLSVRDDFVFQTFISWYSQKKIWDISPGFNEPALSGRPVLPDCLFCHSTRFEPQPDVRNRYQLPLFRGHGIGCERCHGPGEKHVSRPTSRNIVNPRKLPWQLRENVCEQCHLQGEMRIVRRGRQLFDYRPGLPLEAFLAIHVGDDPSGDKRRANNHVEQMYQSVCFQKSADDRKLGCISCHDPHVYVTKERRVEHYRARCLTCHQNKGCKLHIGERWRRAAGDSCIQCHMPHHDVADIVHASATDHRIPRRRGSSKNPEDPVAFPLVNFYRGRPASGGPESRRDLGLAIARHLSGGHPMLEEEGPRGLELLEGALKRAEGDLEAREGRADLLRFLGHHFEAHQEYETVLATRPRRERSLVGAALTAEKTEGVEAAVAYFRRLVELSPYQVSYRADLAGTLLWTGKLAEALVQTRAWLRLDPLSLAARERLFTLLLQTGRKDEARRELEVLRRLRAPHVAAMEAELATAGK